MHDIEKWPNLFYKSYGVNTLRLLKFVWKYFNILHESVKSDCFGFSRKILILNWGGCFISGPKIHIFELSSKSVI